MTQIPSLHPRTHAWLLDGPLSPHVPAYISRLKRGRYAAQYVEADLAMKQKALAKLQDPNTAPRRFRASDSLLEFLKKL